MKVTYTTTTTAAILGLIFMALSWTSTSAEGLRHTKMAVEKANPLMLEKDRELQGNRKTHFETILDRKGLFMAIDEDGYGFFVRELGRRAMFTPVSAGGGRYFYRLTSPGTWNGHYLAHDGDSVGVWPHDAKVHYTWTPADGCLTDNDGDDWEVEGHDGEHTCLWARLV